MIRVGVVGATGYAGAELVRILAGHPEVTLTILTSRQYKGIKFAHVFPALAGLVDLECEEFTAEKVCAKTDVVFTALPHRLSMQTVPSLVAGGKKVIDLSADFRFHDPDLYESHYEPHTAKDLLAQSVYGLSEIYTEEIRSASLVGNPGCYPTSILLPLIPLFRGGYLDENSIIADSKSGVSGAGRSPSLTSHFCEASESFKPYKVASHRHNPEINEILSRELGRPVHITFVPHLVPMSRGMEATIYADFIRSASETELLACIASFYEERPFIRLCPENRPPDTRFVRGTNFCDIGLKIDRAKNRLILMSAIDNLVKGAAGQAVQNMNLMLGFPESAGLLGIPYPV